MALESNDLARLAIAVGGIPSPNQEPFFYGVDFAVASTVAVGSTDQKTLPIDTDADFVCTAVRVGFRKDSDGTRVVQNVATPGATAGASGEPDVPFRLQIRDSASSGRGICDSARDATLWTSIDGRSERRLPRAKLYRAGATLTIEYSALKVLAAAGTLSVVLEGYKDYTRPSSSR